MSALNIFLSNKANKYLKEIYPETSKLRREQYFLRSELIDPKYGKDIRMFKMKAWFLKIYHALMKKRIIRIALKK